MPCVALLACVLLASQAAGVPRGDEPAVRPALVRGPEHRYEVSGLDGKPLGAHALSGAVNTAFLPASGPGGPRILTVAPSRPGVTPYRLRVLGPGLDAVVEGVLCAPAWEAAFFRCSG